MVYGEREREREEREESERERVCVCACACLSQVAKQQMEQERQLKREAFHQVDDLLTQVHTIGTQWLLSGNECRPPLITYSRATLHTNSKLSQNKPSRKVS